MAQEFRTLEEFATEFPSNEFAGERDSLMPISGGFTRLSSQFQYSDNLADPSTITKDTFQGSNGVPSSSLVYDLSGFVAVTPGDVLYFSYGNGQGSVRFLTAYDSSKVVRSGDGINSEINSYTVPADVAYVKVTFYKEGNNGYAVYKNTQLDYIVPFGINGVADSGRVAANAISSYWVGKRLIQYGDSITAQKEWQNYLKSIGLDISDNTNFGVGGTRITGAPGDTGAMCQDTRINALPTSNVDSLLVIGGTNDWAQDVVLGSEGSTDPLEFYGGLNTMFEKLTTKYPSMTYFTGTPPYGEFTGGAVNGVGLTLVDYAEAMRVAARKWGIPLIDIQANEGVNSINVQTWRKNDGSWIHPTAEAGERIARIVTSKLYEMYPLDNRRYY